MMHQVVTVNTAEGSVQMVSQNLLTRIVQKHLLDSCIQLMAVAQQELLWETIRMSFEKEPDTRRSSTLLMEFTNYKHFAVHVINDMVSGLPHEGPLPEIHPAIKLSREQDLSIHFEFQQDLRDFVPEDLRPPVATWIG